jgi:C1A family cysteine protease
VSIIALVALLGYLISQ